VTVGVFVIGALGDVATMATVGAAALAKELVPTIGLVSELEDFRGAGLVGWDALRFGGVDVRAGDLVSGAHALAGRRAGLVAPELVTAVEPELAAATRRIGRGFLCGAARPIVELASADVRDWHPSPREAIAAAREAIRRFRGEVGAKTVVVVQLGSTEPRDEAAETLADEAALERALSASAHPEPVEGRAGLPASVLYAIAAQDEGCAYVNFTPCAGATAPALRARAERLGLVHAGRDGKTGETLLKSVLAPLFAARNMKILSWAGYNILGNRDGQALADPGAKAAKKASKGTTVTRIMGPDRIGTEHVEIEYVPSIGDWKTAWDHIHFEGFLGVRMALELTWRGADTALAAPLVLDLVRLVERAARAGRKGLVPELAAFFKDPLGTDERAFPQQMDMLRSLAKDFSACRT
jgi:myo-inositol-1-phosphate synthase